MSSPPSDELGRGHHDGAALDEALARARRHARNALAEALEAGRALLDAGALAATGTRAGDHPLFAKADAWIQRAASGLSTGERLPAELGAALAEALDAEIARWEQRARGDDDARPVLRAFLGLRELLWELGVRSAAPAAAPSNGIDSAPAKSAPRARPRARRVERIAVVEGESEAKAGGAATAAPLPHPS